MRVGLGLSLVALLVGSSAHAQYPATSQPTRAEPVVDQSRWSLHADTDFVLYELRTPRSPVTWQRRRLVQRAGFREVVRLAGEEVERPWRLILDLELRLDQEFGDVCVRGEDSCLRDTDPDTLRDYQPLAALTRLDVPTGGVELLAPDGTRIRVGRIVVADAAGFVRLDGLRVQSAPRAWLGLEAWLGRQATSAVFAGSDGFAPDGALRLDLPDAIARSQVPWSRPPGPVFASGGTLSLGSARYVRASLVYREVRDGEGLVARRAGVALRSSQSLGGRRLGLRAQAIVDASDGTVVDAVGEATLDALPSEGRVGVRVTHHVPRFDLGTIWAWFRLVPTQRLELLGAARLGELRFDAALMGRRSVFEGDGLVQRDAGARMGVRLRRAGWRAGLRAELWEGSLAPTAAMLLDLERAFARGSVYLRGSVWRFEHPNVQELRATSTTLALGARARVSEVSAFRFEAEWSQSRIVGHRFRGLASLALRLAR